MHTLDWLDDLQTLAARFTGLGINPDLAGLSVIELWALYRFLTRLAGL
ncbi:MAG: hypothetical protein PHH47_12860 [Gallionella sp.]|nr:hypothetical protein [Gallionella sp.]MDD4946570.1 hypothetical protein [Gallionella sp.]